MHALGQHGKTRILVLTKVKMANRTFRYDLLSFLNFLFFFSRGHGILLRSLRASLFHSIMIVNVREGEIKMRLHFASGHVNVLYFLKRLHGDRPFCGKKIKPNIKKVRLNRNEQ